ncbi:MAG: methyltransferase domain-containing protein [Gammaproteobacteria bacterium]|nr:methyltransferase domain-containing protein [Gammaproteobacteria bacterium]
MRETPDIETASDDYATRFHGPAGEYFLNVQRLAVKRALGQDCKERVALELGGGHGQLIPILEQAGCEIVEYGSDDSCHLMLSQRHPETELQNVSGNLLALPFADQSVDLVIYVRLISHIEGWPQLIKESCRVASQTVIFDYPSVFSANALTPLLFGMKKGVEKNTRTYLSFSKRQLRQELEKHGFKITAHIPQFILPMFLHRKLNGSKFLQFIEKLFQIIGITHLFGSPVILRADRTPGVAANT